VVQWINPITWFMSGNQISANVYLGESSAPEVEAEILDRVGTYGRQLGQITDLMIVLLRHLPDRAKLSAKEREAVEAFEKMARAIADVKKKHKLQAFRP
jgi:CHAD domain-containing protein